MSRRRRSTSASLDGFGQARRVSGITRASPVFDDSTDAPDSWSVPRVVAVSPSHTFDRIPSLYAPPDSPPAGLFFSPGRTAPEFLPTAPRMRVLAVPRGRVLPKAQKRFEALSLLQVAHPQAVYRCVARKVRKSVLFAKKVAGRGGGSPGPYHRTFFSTLRC